MPKFFLFVSIGLLTFGVGNFSAKTYWANLNTYKNSASKETIKNLLPQNERLKIDNLRVLKTKEQNINREKIPNIPFCEDKEILLVWKHLLEDRSFQQWQPIDGESLDCKDMLKIKKIDLNQDGNEEILLRGSNFNLCSAVGNCAFWIYENKGKSYQKILYSTDYSDVSNLGEQKLKTKTKKYSDILLKHHLSASDTNYSYYKFDGKRYKLSKNLVNACIICNGDNPKWKMMSWNEYKKQNH